MLLDAEILPRYVKLATTLANTILIFIKQVQLATYYIMDDVCEGPRSGHADEWDGEDHPVKKTDEEGVEKPHAFTVEVRVRRVILAACRSNVHLQFLLPEIGAIDKFGKEWYCVNLISSVVS